MSLLTIGSLVSKDVKTLRSELARRRGSGNHKVLLDIFLRRSDGHIAAMCTLFESIEHKSMDTAVDDAWIFGSAKRRIIIHAIRTASNMVRRDVQLIKSDLDLHVLYSPDKIFGIRICRMQKYPQHWYLVLNEFEKFTGQDFISFVRVRGADFGEFMINFVEKILERDS